MHNQRWLNSMLMAAACVLATPCVAQQSASDYHTERPSGEEMMVDAAVARPLGMVATVGGAALFVVTLPFSLAGGNAAEAADRLVVQPGRETFVRCLGCRGVGRDKRVRNER